MRTKILASLALLIFTSYVTIAVSASPEWSYDEEPGWGAIEDASQSVPLNYPFAECSIGKHQSPVDVTEAATVKVRPLNKLAAQYGVDNTPIFYNSGHAIQVNTSSSFKGGLKIGKELMPLAQLHFHAPSEHAFEGKRFPAELHFVHINQDGRITVLAVTIDIGEENEVFQTILDNMPYEGGADNSTAGAKLKVAKLLPSRVNLGNLKYLTLAGSLTTPPCSEGVQWYFLTESITISAAQLDQMRTFYGDNARSIQDLNGRSILSNK